jgi:multiple sugar transport system ATP-binding protein
MTLGHRVAVMRDGFLQQIDTPQRLYDRPANLFVGEFIGSTAMNLTGADVAQDDGSLVARFGEHELEIPDSVLTERPALRSFAGKRLILGIRPEDIEDASLSSDTSGGHRLRAVVDIREDMGSEVYAHFTAGGPPVRGEDVKAAIGAEAVEIEQLQSGSSVFVGRLDRATVAREGEPIELTVDVRRLHFFDSATGRSIFD